MLLSANYKLVNQISFCKDVTFQGVTGYMDKEVTFEAVVEDKGTAKIKLILKSNYSKRHLGLEFEPDGIPYGGIIKLGVKSIESGQVKGKVAVVAHSGKKVSEQIEIHGQQQDGKTRAFFIVTFLIHSGSSKADQLEKLKKDSTFKDVILLSDGDGERFECHKSVMG